MWVLYMTVQVCRSSSIDSFCSPKVIANLSSIQKLFTYFIALRVLDIESLARVNTYLYMNITNAVTHLYMVLVNKEPLIFKRNEWYQNEKKELFPTSNPY
jgi:hypothetical protein